MLMLDLNLRNNRADSILYAFLGTRMLGLSPSVLGTNKDTVTFPSWPLWETHAVGCAARQGLKDGVNTTSQLLLLTWGK